jgi:hypothetical protein
MKITISAPTVLNQFEFAPDRLDVFQSSVGNYTFARTVKSFDWPNSQVCVGDTLLGPGEDPRAFDLFGTPACYSVRFNDWEQFVPQLFIQNDEDWICLKLQLADAIPAGKNWGPFTYNGEVYFVHEISPFRVLKLTGDTVSTAFTVDLNTDMMPIDNYPSLRGGCNGLDIGGGLVLGFGHDNYASDARDINTIQHRPYGWCIDMNNTSATRIINLDFEWDNKYKIIDPTAFIKQDGEYYLMTCETEWQWKQLNQTGRNCIYPININ